MKTVTVNAGYIPLVDAAPLIVAQEMGFAAEEGISLNLIKAPSWSSLRDMLAFGHVDVAHMLSPVPVAGAMGLAPASAGLAAVSVISVNGNVIGVKSDLAQKLHDAGHDFAFDDPVGVGRLLAEVSPEPLVFGVPFPFSMHVELLRYWLTALGGDLADRVSIRTVPPMLMADAIAAGEIDAFCVGEPWGSIAVEQGAGALVLPGCAIWSFAPEKVLAMRNDWVDAEQSLSARLVRAVWRAGHWLSAPGSADLASELLSRSHALGLPADILERAITGQLILSPAGELRRVPHFLEFHAGAASFPWRSQAKWIGARLAARHGKPIGAAMQAASQVFRSDLHRTALKGHADLPGASSKLEGALGVKTAVASESGSLQLLPDRFFDGQIFDPNL